MSYLEHHDLHHGDRDSRVLPCRGQTLAEHDDELLVHRRVLPSQHLHVLPGELESRSLHRKLSRVMCARGCVRAKWW